MIGILLWIFNLFLPIWNLHLYLGGIFLFVEIPPGVGATVVEDEEEAAKEVAEESRKSAHHKKLNSGGEFASQPAATAFHKACCDYGTYGRDQPCQQR